MTDGQTLIVGAVLVDNLTFADGSTRDNVPGGAGLYALAGAALFAPGAVLITGTGEDLKQTFGPWMDRNGLTTAGLRFADPFAPRNLLHYAQDGSRTETPVFGDAHFSRIEPRPADLLPFAQTAEAIYVFRNTDRFWEGLGDIAFRRRPLVFWEMALDACQPGNLGRILSVLERVDAVSLNLEEAGRIFAVRDESLLLQKLAEWPVRAIFLRAGSRGSFVLHDGKVDFVPSRPVTAIDVTGGGNAYGGAALAGLLQDRPPVQCAAMGTIAAGLAIGQYGPPEVGDPAIRAAAERALADMMISLEEAATP